MVSAMSEYVNATTHFNPDDVELSEQDMAIAKVLAVMFRQFVDIEKDAALSGIISLAQIDPDKKVGTLGENIQHQIYPTGVVFVRNPEDVDKVTEYARSLREDNVPPPNNLNSDSRSLN